MKLVTVVIPCFNSGVTLPQTIESVKAQTYTNIEIIVVDDISEDNSLDVLKKFKKKIKIKKNKRKKHNNIIIDDGIGFGEIVKDKMK